MQLLTALALGKYLKDSPALEGRTVGATWRSPSSSSARPAWLIAKQPDFGTAFLLLLIFFTVMLTARLKLRTLGAIIGLARWRRSPIFRHLPARVPAQARRGVLESDLRGRVPDAPGAERHRFGALFRQRVHARRRRSGCGLPGAWTDFPFAVWAEEWGFLGCFVVLAAYLVLVLWMIKIAGEARDRFGATVCVGVAAMLFWHVFINVGMVSGLLPVVGVTLPLVSYGGSSILTITAALGLVMNVSVRRFSY